MRGQLTLQKTERSAAALAEPGGGRGGAAALDAAAKERFRRVQPHPWQRRHRKEDPVATVEPKADEQAPRPEE